MNWLNKHELGSLHWLCWMQVCHWEKTQDKVMNQPCDGSYISGEESLFTDRSRSRLKRRWLGWSQVRTTIGHSLKFHEGGIWGLHCWLNICWVAWNSLIIIMYWDSSWLVFPLICNWSKNISTFVSGRECPPKGPEYEN